MLSRYCNCQQIIKLIGHDIKFKHQITLFTFQIWCWKLENWYLNSILCTINLTKYSNAKSILNKFVINFLLQIHYL